MAIKNAENDKIKFKKITLGTHIVIEIETVYNEVNVSYTLCIK